MLLSRVLGSALTKSVHNNNSMSNIRFQTHTCVSSYAFQRKPLDLRPLRNSNLPVIFVIGGPGSGKGTQCEKIVGQYGYTHLSSGDLLREVAKRNFESGRALKEIIHNGELAPSNLVMDVLAEAMLKTLSLSKGFLIDGFPREKIQAIQFEENILPCTKILYFELPDEVMKERLLNRAKTSGRADDNEDTILKRLKIFNEVSKSVIDLYKDRCHSIVALNTPDEIYKNVQQALKDIT